MTAKLNNTSELFKTQVSNNFLNKGLVLILALFLALPAFAQERKTYKGPYTKLLKNGVTRSGHIEYDYIETEAGRRIFDGHYSWGNEEGNYKRGIKDGVWKIGNQIRTYSNGKLNGTLTNPYGYIEYKDNRFTGSFSIHGWTGQFDENGRADGVWTCETENTSGLPYYVSGVKHKIKEVWEHGYLRVADDTDESTGETKSTMSYISPHYSLGACDNCCFDEGRPLLKREADGEIYHFDYYPNTKSGNSIIVQYFFDKDDVGEGETPMEIYPLIGRKVLAYESEIDSYEICDPTPWGPNSTRDSLYYSMKYNNSVSNFSECCRYNLVSRTDFNRYYRINGKEKTITWIQELEKKYEKERDDMYSRYQAAYFDKAAFEKEYDELSKDDRSRKLYENYEQYKRRRDELFRRFSRIYNQDAFNARYRQIGFDAMQKEAQQKLDEYNLETFKNEYIQKYKNSTISEKSPHAGLNGSSSNGACNAVYKMKKNYLNRPALYSAAVQFAVENNKDLNKIWKKDGKYFDDPTDFFEAYTHAHGDSKYFGGKSYKEILKQKKKEKSNK